jgi:hypothetical protein
VAKVVAREVSCGRGRVFLACAAEARGWISPGPPLHTCSGPLVGEAQCRARCRCARVRWFCHLGPFPRAPLDPQEIGKFPKGNVSCRTPGINRTPAKVRRRAASRNLLRPPDATPQRDEVKAESANLVKAEPVLHGEEIPAEKSWCSWTMLGESSTDVTAAATADGNGEYCSACPTTATICSCMCAHCVC